MSRLRSRMLMMEPMASAAAPEVPLTISGLQGWWDFSDATKLYTDAGTTLVSADADPIYRCADKSGNSRHLNQSTLGNRPLYKTGIQNSKSIARFDGTDDQLRTAAFTYNQPNTIFLVFKSADATRFDYFLSALADFGNALFKGSGVGAGAITMYAGDTGPAWFGSTAAAFQVVAMVFSDTSSTGFINGTAMSDGDASAGNLGASGVVLGDRYLNDKPFGGDIAELLIYNAALSNGDRQTIQTYLGTKWNITIS